MQFNCIMGFQNSASGFWIIWIIGPLGIALDCRPGSNVIAPSHPYIQQVHARRPTVNERLPSNTPNKILRAPVIDIVGLRCLYVYLFLQMQTMCYVYKKYMYSLVTSKACTGGHILPTTECNAKWGTCWALLKPE